MGLIDKGRILPEISPIIHKPVDDSIKLWISSRGSRDSNTVSDLSKYKNNGKIIGAVWTANGFGGQALSFDGIDDYVNCGNKTSLDITDNLTMEAWVNLDTLYSSTVGHIARKDNAYAFGMSDTRRIGFYRFNSGAPGGDWYMGATSIPLNEWHHVAVTYNSATGTKVYFDGVLDGTSPTLTGTIDTSAIAIVIGNLSPTVNNFLLHGKIDEVRVSNCALNSAEIMERYNETKQYFGK